MIDLGRAFDQDSYSPFGLLVRLGASDALARGVTFALGAVLLVVMWRRRSFALAIAASLALVRSSGSTTTHLPRSRLRSGATEAFRSLVPPTPDLGLPEIPGHRHRPHLGSWEQSWRFLPSCSTTANRPRNDLARPD